MQQIQLITGELAYVDDDDFNYLKNFIWKHSVHLGKIYARLNNV